MSLEVDTYVDFSALSVIAQRIFVYIEKQLMRFNKSELHISKKRIAYDLDSSLPNIKIGLRELKKTRYIIPKNKNSSIVSVGRQYGFGTIKAGEVYDNRK